MELKINFSGRAHKYNQAEIDAVIKAMQNADPLTQGRYLKEFEAAFSNYIKAQYSFALCNATAALELAAELCQFKTGDEVIIPSHTFTSSAYPFMKKGARIVWADIDLEIGVVTAQTIKENITPRTKAIVVVHLYGYTVDMPEIMKIAKEHNLLVIEDAAQSLGSEINGRKSGTFGDFGIFSFQSHKNITTLGEGGMLIVKNKKHAQIIPMLRHNGHCDFSFKKEEYWLPAMGNVDLPELNGEILWPNNYCLGEIECALGVKLLKRIDRINEEKRERAVYFIDELKKYTELKFSRIDNKRHTYHLLVARFKNGTRNEFIRQMFYEKGIKCIVQYCPLNRYPAYQKAGFGEANCHNADEFFDNMVSFPFHHWMSEGDFKYMLSSTKDVLEALRR